MQRQQQQQADYDLLAVFSDETKAEAAETKLHKEGFSSDEVFRLAADVVRGGQFREHGPKSDHSSVFLQTTRSGPNPTTVVLLGIIFGVVLGLLTFAAHFAFSAIPELTGTLAGVVVGIIIGAVIGLLRRGPVRGNIGQDVARTKAASTMKKPSQDAKTVVALRFPDAENITRKSRARAILLNNGGKIDRSVGKD
ncbi:MAG TPA: hypothetical protein VNG51_28780 [Ktedonobacteraceae bacterium]|nr:hypothetical protein [Ktedonobacteraceae bacterium]